MCVSISKKLYQILKYTWPCGLWIRERELLWLSAFAQSPLPVKFGTSPLLFFSWHTPTYSMRPKLDILSFVQHSLTFCSIICHVLIWVSRVRDPDTPQQFLHCSTVPCSPRWAPRSEGHFCTFSVWYNAKQLQGGNRASYLYGFPEKGNGQKCIWSVESSLIQFYKLWNRSLSSHLSCDAAKP